jgi:hypothetical protein
LSLESEQREDQRGDFHVVQGFIPAVSGGPDTLRGERFVQGPEQ